MGLKPHATCILKVLNPIMKFTKTTLFLVSISLLCLLSANAQTQEKSDIPSLPKEKHPFVYFTIDEFEKIKGRMEREPYRKWSESLKKRVESYVENPDAKIDHTKRMQRTKELAFAYWIYNDSKYAELSVDHLLLFEDTPKFKQGGNYPIKYARILFDGCASYDLLYGYLQYRPMVNQKIRRRLAKGAQASYNFAPFWYSHLKNNWGIRQYSALGLAALVLADGVDGFSPSKWWSKTEKSLDEHFRSQITPVDGGFCEGISYLAYSADLHLPYSHARFRATGDNLLMRDYMKRLHHWTVDVLMPDGNGPMFDDSRNARFQFEQLCMNTDTPDLYRWAYLKSGGTHAGINPVDAICNYDDSPTPREPESPSSRFLPEAGNMIFRSGWGKDAVYGLFLGEHGQARIKGGGHEHNDVGSFQIFAHGEWLYLDGGYGGWTTNHRTNTPDNHNMILVDGKGPASVEVMGNRLGTFGDGFLSEYEKTERYEHCLIEASYSGCDIKREIYFIDGDTFLIFDRMTSDSEHEYTLPFHFNGGFETGGNFVETPDGAVLTRNEVFTQLSVVPIRGDVKFATRSDEHAFRADDYLLHKVREIKVAGDVVAVLSIIRITTDSEIPEIDYLRYGNEFTVSFDKRDYEIEIRINPASISLKFR